MKISKYLGAIVTSLAMVLMLIPAKGILAEENTDNVDLVKNGAVEVSFHSLSDAFKYLNDNAEHLQDQAQIRLHVNRSFTQQSDRYRVWGNQIPEQ